MIVHAMDDEAMYPYNKPAMQKLFGGLRQLLARMAADRPPA